MSRTPAFNVIVPKNPAVGVNVVTPVAGFSVTATFAGSPLKLAFNTLYVTESPSVSVLDSVNEIGAPPTDVWVTSGPRNGRLLIAFVLPVRTAVSTAGTAEPSLAVTVSVVSPALANPACGVTLTTASAVSVNTLAPVIVTGLTGCDPLSWVPRILA